MSDFEFVNLTEELAPKCAELELSTFDHANPEDLLQEEDMLAYARTFPEGFFVVLHGDKVVGQAGGIYLNFDFDHPQHTIAEITGDHQCANHDPDGDWYYGTDIIVHPDYRRRGIGKELYELRKALVIRDGKKGIIAGGYLPGYADHKSEMSASEYCDKVVAGELYDGTLSFQLQNGFEVRGVLENYIEDDATDGWASLIVWRNEASPG